MSDDQHSLASTYPAALHAPYRLANPPPQCRWDSYAVQVTPARVLRAIVGMNDDKSHNEAHHDAAKTTGTKSNGSPPVGNGEFARRARAVFSDFPSGLDAQMRSSPYVVLGIAFGIGMGAGVLLGSRILRSVLTSTISYAAIEIGRSWLRDMGPRASAQQ